MKSKTILLIDDERLIRDSLSSYLREENYTVVCAASGEEGLAVLESQEVNLVISDLKMGAIDGLEVLRRSKEHNPLVKFIMHTGYADTDSAITALRRGADDFLSKPCDIKDLIFRVSGCLKKQELEMELRLQNRTLKTITENAVSVIALIKERRVDWVNPAVEKVFGYTLEQAVGMQIADFFPSVEEYQEVMEQTLRLMKKGEVYNLVSRFIKCDGTFFWGRVRGCSVDPENIDQGVILLIDDVSAEKVIEETLIEAKKKAERANSLKSEFLANMSHEIRTPMTAIIGMTGLVLESDLTDNQRTQLDSVKSSADALLYLLNDILDYSKIEAGELHVERRPFNIHTMVADCLQLFHPQAEEKGLHIACSVASEVPEYIIGDENRLRQVLVNLLGNSIKFTTSGDISLEVEPAWDRYRGFQKGELLRFVVADTGIGIPEEKLLSVFAKFTQVDASSTRSFGGAGLGLAICDKLVQLMGGEIRAESEVNHGSRFIFTLPYVRATKGQQEQLDQVSVAQPLLPQTSLRVLLVEDTEFNRDLAVMILEQKNHSVAAVGNVTEALDLLAQQSFDVIIMDLQMPGIDGVAATKIIRLCEQGIWPEANLPTDLMELLVKKLRGTRTPIVALTAHTMEGDRERCLHADMDEYLAKPFQPEAMMEVLGRVTRFNRPPN